MTRLEIVEFLNAHGPFKWDGEQITDPNGSPIRDFAIRRLLNHLWENAK